MWLFNWFSKLFSTVAKIFQSFIDAVFTQASKIIVAELKEIAIEIVAEIGSTDLSNEEKRNEAFTRIKESAKEKGLEARDSLINLIIELAVQYLKNNTL